MGRCRSGLRSSFCVSGAGFVAACLVVCLVVFQVIFGAGLVLAGDKFVDTFDRPDGLFLGEGWEAIPLRQPCVNWDEQAQKSPEVAKDIKKDHKLFSEISQEIEETAARAGGRTAKGMPGPQTAEISNGMLYLHYGDGQSPVVVQRVINKKIMRLSLDLTPLYAMGGEDDRAWMAVKIQYLDHEDRVLGEIRYYHYNAVLDEYANSDTVHSIRVKEVFSGDVRHVVVDAGAILKQRLPGVDARKIARTRLSLEVSSNLCGATVEGYVDNIAANLADAAGLMRFTREELNALVQMGMQLHARDPRQFSKSWIDALIQAFGREKIVAWLSEIPQEARTNPEKLISIVKDTYGFSGQQAFDTAFAIQYLLHAM
ncbi:MAG: hypothetical protein HW380_2480 [Magnetococcales bacterium]|nr:hypothetical protein [Magnetococcales bacterium]